MTRRLTATIAALLVITLLLAGAGTFLLSYRAQRRQAVEELQSQTTSLSQVTGGRDFIALAGLENCDRLRPALQEACQERKATSASLREGLRLEGIVFAIFRPDGTSVNQSGDPTAVAPSVAGREITPDVQERLRSNGTIGGWSGNTAWALTGKTVTVPNRSGALVGQQVLFVVGASRKAALTPGLPWFALSSLVTLGLGALAALWLGRRFGRPVHAATETTRRIAGGDLDARIPDTSGTDHTDDELVVLTRSINTMAESLQRARGLERQFLMSVSHDLRTPLTNISGYAEAIADGAMEPVAAAQVIGRQSARLERLVVDLLDLARLDTRRFTFHWAEVDLADVVAHAVDGFIPRFQAENLTLTCEADRPLPVTVDGDRMVQVVGNLLTNALKYARSKVHLAARRDGDHVVLTVTDDGPGVAAEDLPHVFEGLYQARHRPLREESGSGLGLAIVRELVGGMAGSVGISSRVGEGAVLHVRLPLRPPGGDGATPTTRPSPEARPTNETVSLNPTNPLPLHGSPPAAPPPGQ